MLLLLLLISKLLLSVSHLLLVLIVLSTSLSTHEVPQQVLYPWVESSLSQLIHFDLYNFGCIIVLIGRSHPFPLIQLVQVNSNASAPVNGVLDLLGLVETLVLHILLFDLFQYLYLARHFGIQVCQVIGVLLESASLLGVGSHVASVLLTLLHELIGLDVLPNAIDGDESYLVEHIEVVEMTLVEDQFE